MTWSLRDNIPKHGYGRRFLVDVDPVEKQSGPNERGGDNVEVALVNTRQIGSQL